MVLLVVTLIVSIKCLFFLFNEKIQKINSFSKYIYLLGYIILPFIFITKIPIGEQNKYNPKIIISIFILIWTNDTFAYIVGKSIGKHKLLEKISPKKTIEGFIGGIFFTVLASYIIAKYYIQIKEVNTFIWIIIALIVSIFGTIGDLIESKFKRIAGVKDSGKIMPGHGGVLDRLDSIIFAAPIVYSFYQILYYVS
jgi:phosphatidate cytidylyltransferase